MKSIAAGVWEGITGVFVVLSFLVYWLVMTTLYGLLFVGALLGLRYLFT
jgi:hypothetical protein